MWLIHALSPAEKRREKDLHCQATKLSSRDGRRHCCGTMSPSPSEAEAFFFSFFFLSSTGKHVHMMCSAKQRSSNPHSYDCFPWYSPGQWLTMTSAWTVRFSSPFVEQADVAHLCWGTAKAGWNSADSEDQMPAATFVFDGFVRAAFCCWLSWTHSQWGTHVLKMQSACWAECGHFEKNKKWASKGRLHWNNTG